MLNPPLLVFRYSSPNQLIQGDFFVYQSIFYILRKNDFSEVSETKHPKTSHKGTVGVGSGPVMWQGKVKMFFLTATLSSDGFAVSLRPLGCCRCYLASRSRVITFLGEQICNITGKASGAEEKPVHFQARVFSPRTTLEDPGLILSLMDPVFVFLFKTAQLHLKLQCA